MAQDKKFDPSLQKLTIIFGVWAGANAVVTAEGYGTGNWCDVTKDNPFATFTESGDGQGTVNMNPSTMGTCVATLKQNSTSRARIKAGINAAQVSKNLIEKIIYVDGNTGDTQSISNCHLESKTGEGAGTDGTGDVTFTFKGFNYTDSNPVADTIINTVNALVSPFI